MRDIPKQTRQYIGCAYEPRVEGARAWQHQGYNGPEPQTCPGYTTKLPEVSEVVEARFYLHKGSLQLLVRDELSDGLRDGIAILEGAEGAAAIWDIKNPEKS